MTPPPLVSVVIPTINRSALVERAVRSALRQTLRALEVIVAIDGPDESTRRVLAAIDDPRLRVLPLPENRGPGTARHAAVDVAQGQWVALLDDDDEWMPQKLEAQLDVAQHSSHPMPVITCRVVARTERGDLILPRRTPYPGEPLSEYLFLRKALVGSRGLILPSTLLIPRQLLLDPALRIRDAGFEGSDWLLRAVQHDGVDLAFVAGPEPLIIWNCEESRARRSNNGARWRASLAWANADTCLLTPRARASFILNQVSAEARRVGALRAFWQLPWEAFRRGQFAPWSLLAHAWIWLLPRRVRTSLAALLNRRSHTPAGGIDTAPARPRA